MHSWKNPAPTQRFIITLITDLQKVSIQWPWLSHEVFGSALNFCWNGYEIWRASMKARTRPWLWGLHSFSCSQKHCPAYWRSTWLVHTALQKTYKTPNNSTQICVFGVHSQHRKHSWASRVKMVCSWRRIRLSFIFKIHCGRLGKMYKKKPRK